MMQVTMLVQAMMQAIMQVIMFVQTMMQATSDGGAYDITSPFNDESHNARLWVCSDITCENLSFFPWHLISFRLVPMYVC